MKHTLLISESIALHCIRPLHHSLQLHTHGLEIAYHLSMSFRSRPFWMHALWIHWQFDYTHFCNHRHYQHHHHYLPLPSLDWMLPQGASTGLRIFVQHCGWWMRWDTLWFWMVVWSSVLDHLFLSAVLSSTWYCCCYSLRSCWFVIIKAIWKESYSPLTLLISV